MKSRSLLLGALMVLVLMMASGPQLKAHCQIPCGIYDDELRLNLMAEHITTIEKSINQINELSAAGDKNYNQLVRWVMNKEDHANEFMDIVTQYFLSQRIKPAVPSDGKAYEEYVLKTTLLQKMMVSAMKCKQTADLANTAKLAELLKEFRAAYLGADGHQH
ncbi:MAG: superoxide dismutase, Ni [candidate division Zixibacteria bacterium]|nr:superoxide dismutase, Ni [candidate division Zixibacteria bacterium]